MEDQTNISPRARWKTWGLRIGGLVAAGIVIMLLSNMQSSSPSTTDIWRNTDFERLTRIDLYQHRKLPGVAAPDNLYNVGGGGGDVWVGPNGVLQDYLFVHMRDLRPKLGVYTENIPDEQAFTFHDIEYRDREIMSVEIIRRFDPPFFGAIKIRTEELYRAP